MRGPAWLRADTAVGGIYGLDRTAALVGSSRTARRALSRPFRRLRRREESASPGTGGSGRRGPCCARLVATAGSRRSTGIKQGRAIRMKRDSEMGQHTCVDSMIPRRSYRIRGIPG